jgi:hypothetical protein
VKDASVVDNTEVLGNSTQWNVSFVKEAHDWEVGVFASFFQMLHSAVVSGDRADRLWWFFSKKCLFKVKSFSSSLAYSEGRRFSWKSMWWTQAPLRAAFFVWLAALCKIFIMDNLRKRHIIIVDRAYAREMGNLWTTFFFTVMWLLLCSIAFLLDLVCLELCLEELSTCLLVNGSLEGQGMLQFGRWCQSAFFGVFGRKEILWTFGIHLLLLNMYIQLSV